MEQARNVILNRTRSLEGVAEPSVELQGDNRLVVDLPDVRNSRQALACVTSTADLEFYYLKDVVNTNNPLGKWRVEAPIGGDEKSYVFTGPRGERIDSLKQPEDVLKKVVDAANNRPVLTGRNILPSAKANINGRNQIVINIEFDQNGTEIFRKFTARHVGDYVAVFFDGRLVTAPSIQEAIPGGKAEITGFRNLAEAKRTADYLNSGALPVPLEIVTKDKL